MSSFEELAKSRRSAINFEAGIQIPDADFNKIFNIVKLSPSCYNIQHANYLVIRDPNRKESIKKQAFNQHKITTASAVIIVLGDKYAYKNVGNLYNGMKMLKIIDEVEYNQIITGATYLYENRGENFMHEEAVRNAALSAMTFMYAAKELGWDTCPMIGFDPEAIRKECNIPSNLIPVLMITMGKSVATKERQRGYRKLNGEFVQYETY